VNAHVKIAVTRAGFDPGAPKRSAGQRYYSVELRGIARSRNSDFVLQIQPFVFAQNQDGCISRADTNADWLEHPLGTTVTFTAANATEGRLSFLVPEDTQSIRLLVAPAGGDGFILSAGDEFTPSWPVPIQEIDDGSTLRVLLLPPLAPAADIGAAPAGREYVVLDFVIENLKDDQGIEFTTSQQLRMVDQSGKFVQPSAATKQIGCRLDDGDVIPPGHARRLQVAYDMPAGEPRRLNYRGFEVDEVAVDLP